MSDWTDFRDQAKRGLGIDTPENVAKTTGGLIRSQVGETPAPEKPGVLGTITQVVSSPTGKIAGISITTLALVGLGAYLVFSKMGKGRR